MIHEDERRVLEDWPEAKIITAKKDCVLGRHLHKIKTERFVLVSGKAVMQREHEFFDMEIGGLYEVEPEVFHSFSLTKGSVLIGICSHSYDKSDDYTN